VDSLGVLLSCVVAVLVFWLPGIVVLAAARMSRLVTVAAAPAVTLAVAPLGGQMAAMLGFRWNIFWLLMPAFVIGSLVFLLSRRVTRPQPELPQLTQAGRLFIVLGIVAGAAFGMTAYLAVAGGFEIVPQDFDAGFHANAIRYVGDAGDASFNSLSEVNAYATEPSFYPAAYHNVAAIVYQIAGTGVLGALHGSVMNWFLMLPLGVAALARSLKLGWLPIGVAAAVSTWFTSLPYELLWRGLFPFAQTLVLAAAVLAAMLYLGRRRWWGDALLLALMAGGLVAAHTSAAATLGVLGIIPLVAIVVESRSDWKRLLLWSSTAVGLLVLLMCPTIVGIVLGTGTSLVWDWPAVRTLEEGIQTAWQFGTGFRTTTQFAMAVLVWLGVAAAFIKPFRWSLVVAPGMAATMALYTLAVAVDSTLSLTLTGYWWNDQVRVAALPPIVAPVFVGVLAGAVGWGISGAAQRMGAGRLGEHGSRRWMPVVGVLGLAVVLLIGGMAWPTPSGYHIRASDAMRYKYLDGVAVSSKERAAFEMVAELVRPGCLEEGPDPTCRVMNDRGDGSPWMYALDGVRVVFGHLQVSADTGPFTLNERFDELAQDPEVRRTAREFSIEYVFIGTGFTQAEGVRAPGLDAVADQPATFELLWTDGENSLYRVRWETLATG